MGDFSSLGRMAFAELLEESCIDFSLFVDSKIEKNCCLDFLGHSREGNKGDFLPLSGAFVSKKSTIEAN